MWMSAKISIILPSSIFFLFIISNQRSIASDNNHTSNKLLAVIVIFRHGERTPQHSFPNNPYGKNNLFKEGNGQLTNVGKQRIYKLGKWLRQRYSTFLPEIYSANDVEIFATKIDRTLMSGELLATGLYPPKGHQVWEKSMKWQPIPIHLAPEEILRSDIKNKCPTYVKLWSEYLASDRFKHLLEKYRPTMQYVTEKGGYTDIDIRHFQAVADCLFIATKNHLPLPKWAQSVNMTEMNIVMDLFFKSIAANDHLLKLMVGPFYDNMLNFFNSFKMTPENKVKFIAYSGHDSNVASLLTSFDIYHIRPSYGNMVIFELKSNKNKNLFVNVFYKTDRGLSEIRIKGCQLDCSLSDFEEYFKNIRITIQQHQEACFKDNKKTVKTEL